MIYQANIKLNKTNVCILRSEKNWLQDKMPTY